MNPTVLQKMSTANKREILIVEDDDLLAQLLLTYLNKAHFAVTVLSAGEQLKRLRNLGHFAAIVLDILLPGKNGFEWLKWLQVNYPKTPIIVCSRLNDAESRVHGLDLGAYHYIVKPFHPQELIIRLNALLTAEQTPDYYAIGYHQFDSMNAQLRLYQAQQGYLTLRLSPQENQLLTLFCQCAGKIVSRDDIAQVLYAQEHNPLQRNIDMYINLLRKKLATSGDQTQYLKTVWGKGYLLNVTT